MFLIIIMNTIILVINLSLCFPRFLYLFIIYEIFVNIECDLLFYQKDHVFRHEYISHY